MHHLRAHADAERQREHAEDRRDGGHQDRAQADAAGLEQRLALGHAGDSHLVDGIDEHDAVVDDDAHQHQEADHRDDGEVHAGQQQRDQAAGKRQRNREQHDERRLERLELRHHNQEDQHQRDGHHEYHVAHDFVDGLVLAGERNFIALGRLVGVERSLDGVADVAERIALRRVKRHGNLAALAAAGNARQALRLFDLRNVAQPHELAARGRLRLDLEIGQRVGRDRGVAAIDDVDRHRLSIQRRLGDLSLAGELRGDKLQHLSDGQVVIGGPLLVHGDADLGNGSLEAVVNGGRALNAADNLAHIGGNGAQRLHIVADDVHRNARAGQHGDVHRTGLQVQIETHRLRLCGDVLADLDVRAAGVAVDDDVIGQVSAASGHHRNRTRACRQADSRNAVDLHHAVHQLERLRLHLLLILIGVVGKRSGHLRGVDLGHERHAHVRHLKHRDGQQRHRQQQHQRLEPQRAAQGADIEPLEAGEMVLHLLLRIPAPEQRGRHRRNQRHCHDEAGHQRIGDRQANVGKQVVRKARDKHDRKEYADRRQRRGSQRARNAAHAAHAGLQDRQPFFVVQTVNVVDGNNGIVHQHADAQRKARQREHVERNARKIHADKRHDDAQRDRERDDDRRPPIHQEHQQH